MSLGTAADLKMTLQPASLGVQVDVVAAAPLVDARRTVVAAVVGEQQIASLPIDRRNYISFALLAPGVGSDRTLQLGPAESSGLTFAGQSAGRTTSWSTASTTTTTQWAACARPSARMPCASSRCSRARTRRNSEKHPAVW